MQNRLMVLGSGTCVSSLYKPFDFRYPSGYLLQYESLNILLDCSEGIRARLEKIGFDYFQTGYIFISHFHPDHFSLESFLQAIYVRAIKGNKQKKILVYGPAQIETRFSTVWDAKHRRGHYQEQFKKVLDCEFYEFSDKKEISLNSSTKIVSYKVPHGELEAYAMRFKLGERIIVYSGDTGRSENLAEAAKNSNTFICEAAIEVGKTSHDNTHLSPFQAGKIAKKASVKELVLTHYFGQNTDEEMTKDAKKSGFSGNVKVAKDFQTLLI